MIYITPIAVILVILIIGIIFKYKSATEICAVLVGYTIAFQVNFFAGYFVKLAGREIECLDFLFFISSVFGIITIRQLRIKSKTFEMGILLLFWIILGGIYNGILPPDVSVITPPATWDAYLYGSASRTPVVIGSTYFLSLIKFTFFILIMFISNSFGKKEWEKILDIVIAITKIHIVFVAIEIVTKYFMNVGTLSDIRNIIFGLGDFTAESLVARGSGFGICGLTREPSHLAQVMFIFLTILILSKKIETNKIWVLGAIICNMLSMSFSTVMYMAVLIIVYLISYEVKLGKKFAIAVGLSIFALILFSVFLENDYYSGRLNDFFYDAKYVISENRISREQITSSKVRIYGIIETLKIFSERPITGVGFNIAFCNSGLVMILSNIGIVGMIIWINLIKSVGAINTGKKLITLLAIIILPNILKGGLENIYSTYLILEVILISKNESAMSKNKIYV